MKLLLCYLLMFVNDSSNTRNIKASLDSLARTRNDVFLEDATSKNNTDISCYRKCKFNMKPRRCHYHFKIEPNAQNDGKPALTINGITPGPPIHVCVNDIVVVEVENKVPDQDMAIHWHGVDQRGTPYMDGVPMITQCPIVYGSTYKYAFIATSPGTFFYHADSVSHQSDGVYGALIVKQPSYLEPHSSLFDVDRIRSHTVLIGAKFPQLMTGNLEDLSKVKPRALLINGKEDNSLLSRSVVIPGFAYRLRLINGIAVECPVLVTIDQHEMTIIASDGKLVKSKTARKVRLFPGERMDVVVRAPEESDAYWISTRGEAACAGLEVNSLFMYDGANYSTMAQIQSDAEVALGQSLQSIHNANFDLETKVKPIYLGIDKNVVDFEERDVDFNYISASQTPKPFFPAPLLLQENGVVQINKKSFLYPNAPILLRRGDFLIGSNCNIGEEDQVKDPQCTMVLNAEEGDVLELALVNEGFGSNDSYTFHMHSYGMQVVATWQNPDNKAISKEEFLQLDKEGKIKRNLRDPVIKDTVSVPNKGFAIVRIKIDHGGSWLLECRSCGLFSLPTAILINVPQSIPKSVTDSLPQCGNYKPPDVLLN